MRPKRAVIGRKMVARVQSRKELREPSKKSITQLVETLTPGAHMIADRVLYIRMVDERMPHHRIATFHHHVQELIDSTVRKLEELYIQEEWWWPRLKEK